MVGREGRSVATAAAPHAAAACWLAACSTIRTDAWVTRLSSYGANERTTTATCLIFSSLASHSASHRLPPLRLQKCSDLANAICVQRRQTAGAREKKTWPRSSGSEPLSAPAIAFSAPPGSPPPNLPLPTISGVAAILQVCCVLHCDLTVPQAAAFYYLVMLFFCIPFLLFCSSNFIGINKGIILLSL